MRRWRRRSRASEHTHAVAADAGAATVLAAVAVCALVAVALGGVSIGAVVVARHRAQAAADLAALSAAAGLVAGPVAACDRARSLSAVMGAALRGCRVDRLDVVVAVTVSPAGWSFGEARAEARAGPRES